MMTKIHNNISHRPNQLAEGECGKISRVDRDSLKRLMIMRAIAGVFREKRNRNGNKS